jgi:Cu/Ag efflux protein CusF
MRYLLPIILFFSACGSIKQSKLANMTEVTAPKAYIRQNETMDMGAELFQVQSTNIIGNRLYVMVKAHPILSIEDFDLTGSTNISKSMPPIRSIRLDVKKIPIKKGDPNTVVMMEQTLVFDITDLAYKQEAGSQIYLQLEGAKERILYTYK